MILRDDSNGVEITLTYDEDGFPLVDINLGGGFYGEHRRPTVQVTLDGVEIHDMFAEDDLRWDEDAAHCATCGEPFTVGPDATEATRPYCSSHCYHQSKGERCPGSCGFCDDNEAP